MARPRRTRLQGGEHAIGTPEGRAAADRRRTRATRLVAPSIAHGAPPRAAPRRARRARIILACAEGLDSTVVAKRLRMSQTTVCKWRGRFVRERLDGLYDEPRPGAPRQLGRAS